ncbi:MAG: uroporphyrinogen-III synthase [Proteobacteria bacterium]|nr:uroporphyrinogen-III synthase [Pseudomonadota bacterium]
MKPRVLVTRAEEDAAVFMAELEALGCTAVHVPLITRTLVTESTARLRRALVTAEVVLLTSAMAATAVARVWREPVRAPRFAAVGPATAKQAEQLGLPVDVIPDTATGRDLVKALGPLSGVRVLYPRAEVATSATTDALHRAGADLTDIVVYRNTAPPGLRRRLIEAGRVDIVTLFSGSSARRYARAARQTGTSAAPAVVIGPSTAKTAEAEALTVLAIASPHDRAGMLAAVQSALEL